jgi:transcriptional regulator GlxA family with amidase domain
VAQQQFSEPLRFQIEARDNLGNLAAWIRNHLSAELSVDVLAGRADLSVRQFSRVFKSEFGTTPASFVEEVRLGVGSERLCEHRVSIESVARSIGLANEDVSRRASERRFGVSPRAYRDRFSLNQARPGAKVTLRRVQ